jgi:hypothetical protein
LFLALSAGRGGEGASQTVVFSSGSLGRRSLGLGVIASLLLLLRPQWRWPDGFGGGALLAVWEHLGGSSPTACGGWFYHPVQNPRCRAPLPCFARRLFVVIAVAAVALVGVLAGIWRMKLLDRISFLY